MPGTLELEIATPDRLLVSEPVTDVQIPAKNGYLGVLPGHARMLSELGTGFLSYAADSRRRYLSVHGGFVEVTPERVRILANMAERAEEIDVERAREALRNAQQQLANPDVGVDPAVALATIESAEARLQAVAQHQNGNAGR